MVNAIGAQAGNVAAAKAIQPIPEKAAIELLLEPLVAKIIGNTFEVYKTVHQHEREMIKEIVREVMQEKSEAELQLEQIKLQMQMYQNQLGQQGLGKYVPAPTPATFGTITTTTDPYAPSQHQSFYDKFFK